jgi:hypothetical protein
MVTNGIPVRGEDFHDDLRVIADNIAPASNFDPANPREEDFPGNCWRSQ